MKKRHRLVRGFQNGKKRSGGGAPPHRLSQKPKTSRESGRLNSKSRPLPFSLAPPSPLPPRFFHRFAPRISNPSQTSPAARGEPRLRLLRRLLRHEQLPRLRGHRPRQALGNPPSPSLPRSAPEGFGSTPPSRLPPWIHQDRGGPGSSARDF